VQEINIIMNVPLRAQSGWALECFKLDQPTVDASSINAFERRLDKLWNTKVCFH